MSVPIIDISNITSIECLPQIADQITQACKEWGFLLISGHSIPTSDIDDLFTLANTFFNQPDSLKTPYPVNKIGTGFAGSFTDRHHDDKASMWFAGPPGSLTSTNTGLPPFWYPYASKIDAFKHKCHLLVLQLLTCFTLTLGLESDTFAKAHDETVGTGQTIRMLKYPARSELPADVGSRMAPHTDSGSVTLLFQRQPGLEVLSPANEWVKAPCREGCILVNIGDALSFWSGRKLKATQHRVTFDQVPMDMERQTMAYFGKAKPDTVLEPLFEDETKEKYFSNRIELTPGITVGELTQKILDGIYGTRKA